MSDKKSSSDATVRGKLPHEVLKELLEQNKKPTIPNTPLKKGNDNGQ